MILNFLMLDMALIHLGNNRVAQESHYVDKAMKLVAISKYLYM